MSDETNPQVNPWRPMSAPIDLKHMLKMIEELGEGVAAAARCAMQGMDEAEPVTGKVNRRWMEEELGDIVASTSLVVEHFGLGMDAIRDRAMLKVPRLRQWHAMLAEDAPDLARRLADLELHSHEPQAIVPRVLDVLETYGVVTFKMMATPDRIALRLLRMQARAEARKAANS